MMSLGNLIIEVLTIHFMLLYDDFGIYMNVYKNPRKLKPLPFFEIIIL